MKFDFPFKKWTESLDGVTQNFLRIHMKYMHIASHQIQKENKWRQQFLAELSVLHHYIKGMTINTYIMKSNIQNFRDKYIIYSWYVTKFFPQWAQVCIWTERWRWTTILLHSRWISILFFFLNVFFFFLLILKEHEKDRCINI